MAFHTVEDGPWPYGTTVAVWDADDVTGGVPSGAPLDSSVAQADGTVTFGGLTEGGTYVAFGNGGSQSFEAVNQETRLGSVEGRGAATDTPMPRFYAGNATASEYASEPNMPIQFEAYFGLGSSPLPLTGRPQAFRVQAKYGDITTADSAQGGSTQAVMSANAGALKTQTLPVTGDESDALVQDGWDATGLSVGHSFVVEAQGTGRVRQARPIYVAAKAAKDAASVCDDWIGVYVEDPASGSLGTITDKAGVHSEPRIQTESGLIVGVPKASITAAMKGTTLHVSGTNTSGNPLMKLIKKSGSTDDMLQITDSGGQVAIALGQASNQIVFKVAGSAHSFASAVGPMLALGNIATAPTGNYTSGAGGFLYVEAGALKYRGGSGTITVLGVT